MRKIIAAALCLFFLSTPFASAKETEIEEEKTEDLSFHFQTTGVGQANAPFKSPYGGPNSLNSKSEIKETATATYFIGKKLWQGAGLYINPELTQGTGLSNTLGVAGFPNGEATRAGNMKTSLFDRNFIWSNVARLFIRQTFDLGDKIKCVGSDKNQLVCTQAESNLTITAGKFAAEDIFDKNSYANDPRTQFLNWALMANGAWDYPADSKGYTAGIAVELNKEGWSIRAGDFLVPRAANTSDMDWDFWEAFGLAGELEKRYKLFNHDGAMRLLGFINRAHMGDYKDAIGSSGVDVSQSRKYRLKYGAGLNIEQELTKDLGAFARLGLNDGQTESWMFTEIDRTLSTGLSLKGPSWHRVNDTMGLAWAINGLSNNHHNYLNAGGSGFLLGDGKLNYSYENCLETYYSLNIIKGMFTTFDYQLINNPGYNGDRGPVSVFSIRFHFEI